MKSFDLAAEPGASNRLTAAATLFHLLAATMPWVARTPAALAAALSLLAIAGFAFTLARLPGRHATLAALRVDRLGCRVRLRGRRGWERAAITSRSRAYADFVVLDLEAGRRSFGWILSRACLPAGAFRRLKARIR